MTRQKVPDPIARGLEAALTAPFHVGQILVRKTNNGFVLTHRDDEARQDLHTRRSTEDPVEIAKYDDAGKYRPLKTAPNLRHGWRLELATLAELKRALDYFYPGRSAVFSAWKKGELQTTPLRETLNRQSGMYRVAAKISDDQINDVVRDFCRSDGGCLRAILWKRDECGTVASTKLPKEKFDPAIDQAAAKPRSTTAAATRGPAMLPLLCQEPCNLLVAKCRKTVKGE